WFAGDIGASEGLLAMLQQNPRMQGLARIPLMLTLICRGFQARRESYLPRNGDAELPGRRGELYELCLRGLLRDWKEQKGRSPSDAYVDAVLEVLAPAAYDLMAQGREQFTEGQLRDALRPHLGGLASGHELRGRSATSLISELKRDGILISAGDHR